jgi:hypothetical protein
MARYFTGRRQIGEQFTVNISSHKKLLCRIFMFWEDRPGYECACAQKKKITAEKSWGLSKKMSEMIETKLKSSLGVEGISSLESEIKTATHREVEWSYHETETEEYDCNAPECGSHEVRIAQLVYEYEVELYERGWIFRSDVWDRKDKWIIPERTKSITSWDNVNDYDERCKGCKAQPSPEFIGRLSINLGRLCLLAPFKMDEKELRIRIGKIGISYPMLSYHNTARALEERGLPITLKRDYIDPPLLFLAELESEELPGTARVYLDAGTGPVIFEAPVDLGQFSVIHDILRERSGSGGQPAPTA